MRILVVASKFPPEYSGPGVRIPRLYRALSEALGIEQVDVLCSGVEYSAREDYEFEGFRVRRRAPRLARKIPLVPTRLRNLLDIITGNILGLLALIHYADIDLVHILGNSGVTASAIWWANRKNIPILQELVTARARPYQRFFLTDVAPGPNSVIVVFRNDAEEAAREAGYTQQIWKRPNPIDPRVFKVPSKDERLALRKTLDLFGPEDVVILTVGKLMPQKNQVFMLEALSHLPENYKLVIAGPKVAKGPLVKRDAHYFTEIVVRISALGLSPRVRLVPRYVNAHDYMRASDVYVMPSHEEGFGTPMLEAMACGLPVVANSDEAVFGEWLTEGRNAFLRPLQAAAWAEAVSLAAAIPELQRRSEAAQIVALASEDVIYDRYLELIKLITRRS